MSDIVLVMSLMTDFSAEWVALRSSPLSPSWLCCADIQKLFMLGGRPPAQKRMAQRQSNLAPIAEIPQSPQPQPTMISAFSGVAGGFPAHGQFRDISHS